LIDSITYCTPSAQSFRVRLLDGAIGVQ